eukprot:m.121223 g.121223  ORF g.121223 m.121223 type:complete len:615 (+) comp16197_c0_seq2:1108-2952(+)
MPPKRRIVDSDDEAEEEAAAAAGEEGDDANDNDNNNNDDDNDDDAGGSSKRSKRVRTTKRKSLAEGGDSGSGESAGEDEYVPSGSRKGKGSRLRKTEVADDGSESEESVFEYKYGEDFIENEDDREYLNNLNEAQRELELAKRYEEREKARQRWEVAHKLKMERRRASRAQTSGDTRRRPTKEKERRNKVIDELKASRRRSSKSRSRADDDEEEEEYQEEEEEEADNDEEFQASHDEEEGVGRGRRSRDARREEEEEEDDDDADEADMRPASFQDLQTIRLSRHRLEQWCHETFFKDLVTGCFVRIGIGQNEGTAVYRVAQIVGLKEGRIYSLGRTRTNMALLLKHGVSERPFRIEYVSNEDFTENEYKKWRDEMLDNELQIPSLAYVQRKQKDIQAGKDHVFTAEEIRASLASKRRFDSTPINPTVRREECIREALLLREQETPEADARAEELEAEAAQLAAESAHQKEKARSKHTVGVSYINERNRTRNKNLIDTNIHRMQEADVFTRRKTTPSLAGTPAVKSEEPVVKKAVVAAPVEQPVLVSANRTIQSAHNFDLDLDLSILMKPPPTAPLSISNVPPTTTTAKKGDDTTAPTPTRRLNLAEYKKSKGLI